MSEWQSIPSLDGAYEASDDGRIRRARAGGGARVGRLVSLHPHSAGYLSCAAWIGNKQTSRLVHRLVAEAWIGPCPDGQEVNHKNLIKTDNRVVNLEYLTRSENLLHRARAGIGRGERNGRAKLTAKQVHAIRRLHNKGLGYKRLGSLYDVDASTIRSIIKQQNWAWLAEPDCG